MSATAKSKVQIAHMVVVDVVGFSRLSQAKQVKADETLRRIARDSTEYAAASEQGDVIPVDTGDGFALAYFHSVQAPVCTALDVMERAHAQGIQLRIGIHSGPVTIIEDLAGKRNIKGVGINVAVRVLDCTSSMGICMTEHHYGHLRQHADWRHRVVRRGTYTVKHGLRLRICEVVHDLMPAPAEIHETSAKPTHTDYSPAWVVTGIAAILIGSGISINEVRTAAFQRQQEEKMRQQQQQIDDLRRMLGPRSGTDSRMLP